MKQRYLIPSFCLALSMLLSASANAAGALGIHNQANINKWGGEVYLGTPALDVTAALVAAGGGAAHFSFAHALVAMLGKDTVQAEVSKLTTQYGKEKVDWFLARMDFAVDRALQHATQADITLPPPAKLNGTELAKALVKAGTTPDGTFWAGHLFDVALSHNIHKAVMRDIDSSVGYLADKTTHQILNQAMYDVAQALGMKDVKLASLH